MVPVLIRVPALRTVARRRAARRRRLRREVRLTGLVVLLGVPLFAIGAWVPGREGSPFSRLPWPGRAASTAPEGPSEGPTPPQVCLLPELEPVSPPESSPGIPAEEESEEHWVAAWSGEVVTRSEPAASEPMPMPVPMPRMEACPVETPGYLLPGLPEIGSDTAGEEPSHAGP